MWKDVHARLDFYIVTGAKQNCFIKAGTDIETTFLLAFLHDPGGSSWHFFVIRSTAAMAFPPFFSFFFGSKAHRGFHNQQTWSVPHFHPNPFQDASGYLGQQLGGSFGRAGFSPPPVMFFSLTGGGHFLWHLLTCTSEMTWYPFAIWPRRVEGGTSLRVYPLTQWFNLAFPTTILGHHPTG